MSANVRCANPRLVTLDDGSTLPFCGWKGERFASGYRPHVHRQDACGICLIVEERMTDKPCPRCGGRVELIPQEVDS